MYTRVYIYYRAATYIYEEHTENVVIASAAKKKEESVRFARNCVVHLCGAFCEPQI